ncbi:MAG: hypothetical protein PUI85_03535 [Eubacteriales bacterium]|nr:hypothetical protein [Eubacteriales bacterium]MDY3332231.1 hypothetical protein [Gallibacter sp.]
MMQGVFDEIIKDGRVDFSCMEELRRQAFVDCMMLKSEYDNVLGYFGNFGTLGHLDEDFAYFYSCGIKPIPIEGVDKFIFKYGDKDKRYCDIVNSTKIYLNTEKCPLLFSSKIYIVNQRCIRMKEMLAENSKKPVYFMPSYEEILNILQENYDTKFDNKLFEDAKRQIANINALFGEIRKTYITGKELFELEFFSRYIVNLDDRATFLKKCLDILLLSDLDCVNKERIKIQCCCLAGAYKLLDACMKSKNYYVVDGFGQEIADIKYTVDGCFLDGPEKLTY